MNTLERVLSIVLTVATLTVALVVVRREFSEPLRAGQTVNIAAPTGADYFKGWMGLLRHGIIVGDSAAPVR